MTKKKNKSNKTSRKDLSKKIIEVIYPLATVLETMEVEIAGKKFFRYMIKSFCILKTV